MQNNEWNVVFKIEGGPARTLSVPRGVSLLDAAKQADVAIDAPCSGNGTCGKCRIRVLEGTVEGEPGRHISGGDFAEGWRLACLSKPASDLTLLVPDTASAYKTRMKITDLRESRERAVFEKLREELAAQGYRHDSGLETLSLTLKEPALDDAMADRERLIRAVSDAAGETRVDFTLHALRKLPLVLREGAFSCTCVFRREAGRGILILDLAAGDAKPVIPGLAVDIGTTSVSMVLTDLRTGDLLAAGSAGNGQIRFGADVINRIIESTRPGGVERLRKAVTGECVNPLIREMCRSAGLEPEGIYRAAVAGNTTMTHLFMGVPAAHIRLEPYVPAFFESGVQTAASLGLEIHPDAEVVLAPGIGSYVGGDITAGVFSSGIYRQENPTLFIDLGTNGELVFGSADFLMACACSAGPAFEGGDISCGMRATDGAIEACRIDRESLEPALTIIGGEGQEPLGFCGSGLIDVIGELFRCEAINAKGKFIREGKRIRRDEWGIGSYVAVFAGEDGQELAITETDIDNFIRAKGAIFSAIRTMLAIVDFTIDAIAEVYVAGGIGSGINVEQAILIGMLPNLPVEQYHYIGNTSLSGAYAMVNSRGVCEKITGISRGITYLELSSHPSYMDEFVAACFLPHTDGSLFE
ncbi:MAG: ASKHA domain-containing protein [Spirochaetaceae bacterium]|jgi:uncharacterized 2Fe-2S/4Fe-4S cluster protein (DUF4445 family)|nr:ASKHA domain-containing protein [Spirochaetaceae bacterium]